MKALIGQVAAEGGLRRVTLFWGVRWSWELYDLDALRELERAHEWLQVVPCVSQEAQYGEAVEGTAVAAALASAGPGAGPAGPWPGHDLFVCGSPGMVQGTCRALRDAGVPAERMHIEDFGDEEKQR
jgi:NAD(P)H-flavin reductase